LREERIMMFKISQNKIQEHN